MATLRPPLHGDEFDGEASIDSSNGKRRLSDMLTALDNAATNLGPFSNATRPLVLADWQSLNFAAIPAKGTVHIFNTNDNAPNWWDGAAWRDAMGNIT
jgi:hypothetical protein